mmetsp:Transcript_606/g.1206  ORF Transcript_606/g.1206 Transcript_606/m.1206 type:complete len:82 (+) Transcript_606:439-684(+)
MIPRNHGPEGNPILERNSIYCSLSPLRKTQAHACHLLDGLDLFLGLARAHLRKINGEDDKLRGYFYRGRRINVKTTKERMR